MNNEEKILAILETLVSKVENLEAGQAETNVRLEKLEAGQAELKAGMEAITKEVKSIREQTEDLTEFEADMRLSFKELKGVTQVNLYDIASLKHKVS